MAEREHKNWRELCKAALEVKDDPSPRQRGPLADAIPTDEG